MGLLACFLELSANYTPDFFKLFQGFSREFLCACVNSRIGVEILDQLKISFRPARSLYVNLPLLCKVGKTVCPMGVMHAGITTFEPLVGYTPGPLKPGRWRPLLAPKPHPILPQSLAATALEQKI